LHSFSAVKAKLTLQEVRTASKLVKGKNYILQTPYGEKNFQFKEREIFCESIKTNQVGYSALSKTQYANSLKHNLFLTPGYSLNDKKFDNPAYIYSYIIEKNIPTDPAIVEYFKSAIQATADSNVAELRKYAYPVGNNSARVGWGRAKVIPAIKVG
jgi:hypothetical protein